MSDILQRRFISMFDTATEGLWIMTPEGDVSFYNSNFYEQFDLETTTGALDDWISLIHPDDQTIFSERVDEHIEEVSTDKRVISRYRVLKKNGEYCWIEAVGVNKKDEDGEYMVGSHRDITAQMRLETSIKRLAFFDKVSGLPNRVRLKADIDNRTTNITLIKIHLDGIKSYITQYGEQSTTEVIAQIIECLELFKVFPSRFYRSSVDTFSVLLTCSITENELAEMCQEFISLFRKSSEKSGMLYAGGVYLGAYSCNSSDQASDTIMDWANQTCEYALRHEAEHWAICNTEVQQKVERYFFIERNLKTAIDNDKISVKFQPIICSKTFFVTSFEALARWENSEIGEIYPDEFIPSAERKGLIKALGEKVLSQAVAFIGYYNKTWNSDIKINVNVSVLQLLEGAFPKRSLKIIQQQGVKPESVVLELTESVLLEGQVQAVSQLLQLEKAGFRVVMDDFGSGHSSITDFFKLPFHGLKIDRELANESMKEHEPLAYLEFLTMLCGMKNMSVTVEGIETHDMVNKFAGMDVTTFQGYLFSLPLSLEDALKFAPDTPGIPGNT